MDTGLHRRFTLLELVAVLIVFAVLVGVLGPVFYKPHPSATRVNCAGNLKQIGLSLLMYSGDSGDPQLTDPRDLGWFPAANPRGSTNFEPLVRTGYLDNGKVWMCPARKGVVLTTGANSAYRYIGSGMKDSVPNATWVSLAYDVSGNHPDNDWMNVVFADGHVEGAKPGSKPWAEND